MKPVRVLVVDDHAVVRRGVRQILESTGQFDVVGEAADGPTAMAAVERLRPDVVLMDVRLPGLNGIEATRRITGALPGVRVLILSMHGDEPYVTQSLAAGASGYLIKDVDDQDLVGAVLAVHRGERYVGSDASATPATHYPADALSPSERQVLTCICSGRSDREVADDLGVSISSVETHRHDLIDKLRVHSTVELVRYAIQHHIVSRSGPPH